MGTADNIQQTVLLVTKRQEIPPLMSAMMSLFHAILKAFGYITMKGDSVISSPMAFNPLFPNAQLQFPVRKFHCHLKKWSLNWSFPYNLFSLYHPIHAHICADLCFMMRPSISLDPAILTHATGILYSFMSCSFHLNRLRDQDVRLKLN